MRDADIEESQNLLQVAQFLTTFQDYLRGDDKALGKNIAMKDVQEAIAYQGLLEERISLKYQYSSSSKGNTDAVASVASTTHGNHIKELLEDVQCKISDTSDDTKLICRVLKRFEVWMTKDLAETMFMLSHIRNETYGGSPLLNLPSAASMKLAANKAVQFPRKRRWKTRKDPSKTLLLPPNRWTWQEYLRLSYMMSLLPTEEARLEAQHSDLTATYGAQEGLMGGARRSAHKAGEGTKLSQSDLVALWIRAQRNTSAWRHLTQLFRIEQVTHRVESVRVASAGTFGKTLVNQDNDAIVEDFVAHYVGNHSKLPFMVKRDANPMDFLVEWAVTNQVLFTHKYMVKGIITGTIPSTALKIAPEAYELPPLVPQHAARVSRGLQQKHDVAPENKTMEKQKVEKRPSKEDENVAPIKKRRTEAPSEEEQKRLLVAKQSFVLRWFARRNRKVTSILFNKIQFEFPIHQTLVHSMLEKHVPDTVKKILRETYESSDRTFARIDRRMSKFCDVGSFQGAVLEVLEALKLATKELSEESIDSAMDDFCQLHDSFLGNAPTKELIETSDLEGAIVQLESIRPPWVTNCGICEKEYKEESPPVVCCNCEMPMHSSCCDENLAGMSLQAIAKGFGPLQKVFTIRIPLSRPPPDFRNMSGLEWTRLEIVVTVKELGFRLAIHHTEMCKDTLDMLLSESLDASKLIVAPLKLCQPMAVEYTGLLVVEIMSDSPARKAGVKEGDIITHLRKSYASELIDLSELIAVERVKLLKESTGQPVLIVKRPSKPLLDMSKAWFKDLQKKSNKSAKRIFETETIQKFCERCVSATSPSANRNAVEEAKRCLAVIRRLSMESYSIPFHQDGHCSDCENDLKFVSLRRLDQMMISIIDSTALSGAGYKWPFLAPPKMNADGTFNSSKQLSWLPNHMMGMDNPYELLCHGMKIILTAPIALCEGGSRDPFSSERSALAFHFLSLFSSWCLRSSFDIGCVATSGPPTDYSFITEPWLSTTCTICMQPLVPGDASCNSHSCSREACRAINQGKAGEGKEGTRSIQIVSREGAKDSVEAAADSGLPETVAEPVEQIQQEKLHRYNHFASLVGSVLLILPGDPILDIPAHFLHQPWIKAVDRPTPFIVASYLPSYFADLRPGSCIRAEVDCRSDDETDGIFHLLPVLNHRQLNYLQKISDMRSPPGNSLDKITKGWVNLSILNLDGVVSLTPCQLLRKRSQTESVLSAMSLTVAKQASSSFMEELKSTNGTTKCQNVSDVARALVSDEKDSDTVACVHDLLDEVAERFDSLSTWGVKSETELSYTGATLKIQERDQDMMTKYLTLVDATVKCDSEQTREIIDALSKLHHSTGPHEDQDTDVAEEESVAEKDYSQEYGHREVAPDRGSSKKISIELNQILAKRTNDENAVGVVPAQVAGKQVHAQPRPRRGAGYNEIPDPVKALDNLLIVHNEETSIPDETQLHGIFINGGLQAPRVGDSQHAIDLRNIVTSKDLFQAGAIGTFLTRAETAVVAATLRRGHHLLARRLLCPRYRWQQADEQVRMIQLMDAAMIPNIDMHFIDYIFRSDCERSQRETGPVIACEFGWNYKMPAESLPIDVLLGKWFHQIEQRELAQQHLQRHPQHRHLPPPHVPKPLHHHNLSFGAANIPDTQAAHHYGYAWNQDQLVPSPSSEQQNPLMSPVSHARNDAERRVSVSSPRIAGNSCEAQRVEGIGLSLTAFQPPVTTEVLRCSFDATSRNVPHGVADRSKRRVGLDLTNDNDKEQSESNSSWAAQHNLPENASDCQRIRGGGPSQYCPRQLEGLEKSDWGGQAVTAKVETKKGGEIVEADLIGFIDEHSNDVDEDGALNVYVIYVSNLGQLNDKLQQLVPLASLYIVEEGSEEDGIAKDWLEQHNSSSTLDVIYYGTASQADQQSDNRERSSGRACDSGRKLARRFSTKMGSSPLGCLPDGRKLFWMSCDPSFVQLRSRRETDEALRSVQASAASHTFNEELHSGQGMRSGRMSEQGRAGLCCFWGCRSDAGAFLSLDGNDELVEHLAAKHNYTSTQGKLRDVASGAQIVSLASALVDVVCARWPPLLDLTTNDASEATAPSGRELQFDLERILAVTRSKSETSLTAITKDYPGNKTALKEIVRLWSRLARLFDLERNGALRIDPKDMKVTFPPYCYDAIDEAEVNEKSEDHCFDGKVTSEQLQFTQCQLCSSDSEACVKNLSGDDVGLGCSLIGSIGRITCPTSVYHGISASLSMAKSLLVHTATNMPQALRQAQNQRSRSTQALSETLWDDGSFQEWCKFVEFSTSTQMLAQSLVVLISSLHKSKLPGWWNSEKAGWSKPFVVMTQPTSSGLLLQLYVLDAAVASFQQLSSGKRDDDSKRPDPVPKKLRALKTEERMRKILEWATELGVAEVDDSHGICCVVCQDGGDLLWCTYCETVQHGACCNPPMQEAAYLSQWVCDSCIKDISELRESDLVQ